MLPYLALAVSGGEGFVCQHRTPRCKPTAEIRGFLVQAPVAVWKRWKIFYALPEWVGFEHLRPEIEPFDPDF
jgi:hypothetical protein